MPITGAIFDCDGTILDSMPMWTDACVGLLQKYGVQDAHRVFLEHESLDMDKKCFWYHDNLGIGISGEALYRELWDIVQNAYGSVVRPYDGCREFLDELRGAHVPCVIVSSTPPQLVRVALRMHGLEGYFDEVIFAGEVGRGKEYPDCYLHALRRLGTPRENTWVFEDAPFGVRSATRAGMPTAAILNDHDGRDPRFLDKWATVVVRSYHELSISRLDSLLPRVSTCLVVGGSPEPSSPELVSSLASSCDFVVAADKGAEVLRRTDVAPNVFCGDEDSVSDEARAWAHAVSGRIELHPAEKDDTDLGLAIQCAREHAESCGNAFRLTLTCVSGGRPDHGLGVLGVAARNADSCPRIVEDGYTCHILSPAGQDAIELDGMAGATISVVAIAPNTVVSENGMRWNLEREELGVLDDRGISNRVADPCARITCHSGTLAVFVLREP